jgi:hypothetical protein
MVVAHADPQGAIRGESQSGDPLRGGRARRRVRIGDEAAGARVEGRQSAVLRPDPERAFGVEQEGADVVIGQTGGVRGVVQVLGEGAAGRLVAEEAAAGGADPEVPGGVLGEGAHRFVDFGIVDEARAGRIVAVETADRADPQVAAAVLEQGVDRVVDQRSGVAAAVVEVDEGIAVVAAQAPLRAEPEIAGLILQDAVDHGVRQAVGRGEVAEADVGRLGTGGGEGEQAEGQGEQETPEGREAFELHRAYPIED